MPRPTSIPIPTERPRPPRHRLSTTCAALPLLLAVVAAVSPSPAAAADGEAVDREVAALLRRHGIRPVEPPAPAVDFTLPELAGGRRSLSEARGTWVVLTFWATWCGPCRSELPTLEGLHRGLGDDGLLVLGVSVDRSQAPVGPYVERAGLTFPILWDARGDTGAAYRAASIPVTYLVDPAGRVVGISRGARDWSALAAMLERALELMPPGVSPPVATEPAAAPQPPAAGGGSTAGGGTALDLPADLEPPTAEVALSDSRPRVGETFHLDVRILWAGGFDDYLLHPPDLPLPAGVVEEGMSAATSSEDGRNVLTYRLALRADRPGSFALDPIELRYTPRQETTPLARHVAGPTVEVRPATVAGLTPRGLAWTGAGTAGALGLAAGWMLWRRGRRRAAATPEQERWDDLSAAFDEARRLRLGGDAAGFLAALVDLHRELDELAGTPVADPRAGTTAPAPGSDDPDLAVAYERCRFGGRSPSGDELDRLQRRLERRLATHRPAPGAREAATLELRRETAH